MAPPLPVSLPGRPEVDPAAIASFADTLRTSGERVQALIGDYNNSISYVEANYTGPGLDNLTNTVRSQMPNSLSYNYERSSSDKGSYNSSGLTAENLLVKAFQVGAKALTQYSHDLTKILDGLSVIQNAAAQYNADVSAHYVDKSMSPSPAVTAHLVAQEGELNKRSAAITGAFSEGLALAKEASEQVAATLGQVTLMADPYGRAQLGKQMILAAQHHKPIDYTKIPDLAFLVGSPALVKFEGDLATSLGLSSAAEVSAAGGEGVLSTIFSRGTLLKGGLVVSAFLLPFMFQGGIYDDTQTLKMLTLGAEGGDKIFLDPEYDPNAPKPEPAAGGAGVGGGGGGCDDPVGALPGLPDGEWVTRNRGGKADAFWKKVQEQFTGLVVTKEAHYGGVDFDGYYLDGRTPTFIEAKGNYTGVLSGAKLDANGHLISVDRTAESGLSKLADQLARQIEAVRRANGRLVYRSLDQSTIDKLRAFIGDKTLNDTPLKLADIDRYVRFEVPHFDRNVAPC